MTNRENMLVWINSVVKNDEGSSDDEMIYYFMMEGPMSEQAARFYVAQRDKALRDPMAFEVEPFNDKNN